MLAFKEYPEALVLGYAKDARAILETALAAGYQNARGFVNLAFVCAIVDGPQVGHLAITSIYDGSGKLDWTAALKVAATEETLDSLSQGFAQGIDDGAVVSRLGTYVRRFLNDNDFAEVLYRLAIRLNPRDPVALTNLARLLITSGKDLIEAEHLLKRAQNFGDRRFLWWREVAVLLEKKRSHILSHQPQILAWSRKQTLAPRPRYDSSDAGSGPWLRFRMLNRRDLN